MYLLFMKHRSKLSMRCPSLEQRVHNLSGSCVHYNPFRSYSFLTDGFILIDHFIKPFIIHTKHRLPCVRAKLAQLN